MCKTRLILACRLSVHSLGGLRLEKQNSKVILNLSILNADQHIFKSDCNISTVPQNIVLYAEKNNNKLQYFKQCGSDSTASYSEQIIAQTIGLASHLFRDVNYSRGYKWTPTERSGISGDFNLSITGRDIRIDFPAR
ncbi:hypothetical protein NPIL_698881 [Nephila pilipes]|uniref:Uncharacterized protein n=1 Tax=Nephila pilipes TaxID=299642 RepID=A0A8X6U0E9_NEPPI|nr:hypothetical protein NPIL_698881 [Nephila pilipes]